jgi:hypothetical protein
LSLADFRRSKTSWEGAVLKRKLLAPLSSFLEEDEHVLCETGRHPASFLLFAITTLFFSVPTYGLSLALLVLPLIEMKMCRCAVTNKRILARQGILRPKLVRIPVDEVFEARVGETAVGSMFGVGCVEFINGKGAVRFEGIKNPRDFITSTMRIKRTEER